MARHTVRKALIVGATVAGLTAAGAGTAAADHGDDDFRFDHGRFEDHHGFLFDDRGFECVGPFCIVVDGGHGGPGRH